MRKVLIVSLLLVAMMLSACAQATPTSAPAPTEAPKATEVKATDAPTSVPPTQAPAKAEPTKSAPTAAPTEAKPTEASKPAAGAERVTVAGSTTVQPLAEKLAEAFIAANPKVEIDVQGGGSSVGVKSGGEGTTNIGTVSREVKEEEKTQYPDMKIYTIAYDGIAIVVNPEVSVAELSKDQVRDIFSGKITKWSEVGGADAPIVVVAREEGSGTRGAFEELVMGKDAKILDKALLQNSNGAVRTTVATTPNSVAFLSFGYLDASVKALKIGGVEATEANAASGKYPVVRPLVMVTKGEPTGATKAWLDFILSAEGQKMVVAEGYIAVK